MPGSKTYDVVVLGLGGMGSAAAAHLARRGKKVLGLEQHGPSHDRGSSHGKTRIIRLAYSEHPDYVPLLRRAYELWRELETDVGQSLLVETGGLLIGRRESSIVAGALASAFRHGLAPDVLEATDVARRFPQFRLRKGEVAFFDGRAGVLFPEDAVRAHHQVAVRHGAELRFGARARFVREPASLRDEPVRLEVNGETVEAERVVLAAGAWTSLVAGGVAPPLEVSRQAVHWFQPAADPAAFDPRRFPLFIWGLKGESAHPSGVSSFYGIPPFRGDAVKVGFHFPRELADPDRLRRDVSPAEVEAVRAILREVMPELAGRHVASSACMYTSTRDEHFAIGPVAHGRVVLASPCSGHGFKFAPVIGEILADLVTSGKTRHDLGLFALDRKALRVT